MIYQTERPTAHHLKSEMEAKVLILNGRGSRARTRDLRFWRRLRSTDSPAQYFQPGLKAPVGNQCVTAVFPTAPTASLVQP